MIQLRPALSRKHLLVALTFCLLVFGFARLAWGQQNAPVVEEDFGRYLVDHQADLIPFFSAHSDELLSQAAPLLLQWVGRIIFIALAIGWGLDVLLGRGYANLFAPAYDKFRPALFYASGRLAINVFLLAVLEALLIAYIGHARLQSIATALIALFGFISAALQIVWIGYFYRTKFPISVLFYLTLVVVHGFLTLGISALLSRLPAGDSALLFMSQTVAPKIEGEAREFRQKLAAITPARDEAESKVSALLNKIDQAQAEQARLHKEIELARDSQSYLYSQIVKIHARGDLIAARDQLTALLARFPDGPATGLAQGQLNQVKNELAAQEAQTRQTAALNRRLAEAAKAALLARTAHGQATLSELRRALLGKTPGEVSALLGSPSETASNRWGFSRLMVFNPMTDEHTGLAVYFADGLVQSVDYYYGGAAR